MARTSFHVEVLTPDGQIFDDDVEMLSTRTTTGSLGVLANHEPLLAILEPTELRLYRSDSDTVRFAQGEGYLQMFENSALVLVEEALDPESLDTSDLRQRLNEAEDGAQRAPEQTEERARFERDARRLRAFLDLAS